MNMHNFLVPIVEHIISLAHLMEYYDIGTVVTYPDNLLLARTHFPQTRVEKWIMG